MTLFQAESRPGIIKRYFMPCFQVRQTRDNRSHEVPLFLGGGGYLNPYPQTPVFIKYLWVSRICPFVDKNPW